MALAVEGTTERLTTRSDAREVVFLAVGGVPVGGVGVGNVVHQHKVLAVVALTAVHALGQQVEACGVSDDVGMICAAVGGRISADTPEVGDGDADGDIAGGHGECARRCNHVTGAVLRHGIYGAVAFGQGAGVAQSNGGARPVVRRAADGNSWCGCSCDAVSHCQGMALDDV